MQFLSTLLYILLFIFCLSVLIVVHELGHLAAAKFFKIYCQEFSIGFGPKIFKKKRKNGETYFSLRAFPLGGYVAMYGEGGNDVIEGVEVPPERSLANLKKWKRCIILVAGVFNNAVLALLLFFIANIAFDQHALYVSYVNVAPGSIAATEISNGEYISVRPYKYLDDEGKEVKTSFYTIDNNAEATINGNHLSAYALLDTSLTSYSELSYDTHLHFFEKKADGYANLGREIKASSTEDKVTFNVVTARSAFKQYISSSWVYVPSSKPANPAIGEAYYEILMDGETTKYRLFQWDGNNWNRITSIYTSYDVPTDIKEYSLWRDLEDTLKDNILTVNAVSKEEKIVFESSGLSYLHDIYRNDFGASFKNMFTDWGNSATVIVRSFASLFTNAESWKEVGGIVAIGVQTTNILQNLGMGKFLYIWGLISVNLAIINLMPFPGLDGWQLVVVIVEGVFRKEIPEKVKNAISFVGLALLMALMVLILIKDVGGLF